MNTSPTTFDPHSVPVEPFDSIARAYDRMFTDSVIGRAQRAQVTTQINRYFDTGSHVLELNCGTGEDAFSLAARGVNVSAYDSSPAMIGVADHRAENEVLTGTVTFGILRNENVFELEGLYDGVLSNFAGLNCSRDWLAIAGELARLVKPGGHVLLCVMGRTCLWEMIYYLLRGQAKKAFRRLRKRPHTVRIGAGFVDVSYPSVRQAKRAFSTGFVLREWRGIGVFTPPSYCEEHFQQRSGLLGLLNSLDRRFAHLPGVRIFGDHVLLHFVRFVP